MGRLPRSILDDEAFFHVTARATGGAALYLDDADRRAFLDLFMRTAVTARWLCHAYCLMTTHYHLILETRRPDLSKGMHRLNGLYAQGFNRRHGRRGHLFEERFRASAIDREEHFEAACRYVWENSVRAGICSNTDEWPWSGSLVSLL